jgi:hypothetical protein
MNLKKENGGFWVRACKELPECDISVCIKVYGKYGHGMYVINRGTPWYNTYQDGNSSFQKEIF